MTPAGPDPISARQRTGSVRIHRLIADTYRPSRRTLHPAAHLRWMAAIATAVPVLRLDRPADGWTAEAVAAAIERAAVPPVD